MGENECDDVFGCCSQPTGDPYSPGPSIFTFSKKRRAVEYASWMIASAWVKSSGEMRRGDGPGR